MNHKGTETQRKKKTSLSPSSPQSPIPSPQSPKTGYRGSDRVISRTFPELNLTPEEVFALSNN